MSIKGFNVNGTVHKYNYPDLDNISVQKSDIADSVFSDFAMLKPLTINLFDKNTITPNCYINYATGGYSGVGNQNYFSSDFIEVEPGVRYYIEGTNNNQGAYYDKNKAYLSGFINTSTFNNQDIPNGVKYVRFTGVTSGLNTAFMSKNNERVIARDIDQEHKYDYAKGIIADKVVGDYTVFEKTVNSITDFILTVNSLSYLSANQRCIIYLEEGTYTITYALLSSNDFGTYGIYLPDNVDVKGLGKGATIRLDLTGESSSRQQLISTINFNKNNNIENIIFEATNCRYAAHIDNSNSAGNCSEYVKNCKFIHHGCSDGNWEYPTAVGEGTSSGNTIVFENCSFISDWRAYYLHNNTGFTKASTHVFRNCKFVSTSVSANKIAFALESMGSGVEDIVELYGCTFCGYFDSRKVSGTSVDSCDYKMIGCGNGNIPELIYYTNGKTYTVETEHVQMIQNNTGYDIESNTPLKYSSGNLVPMSSGDSYLLFYGVSVGVIESGKTGYVRTGGYMRASSISKTLGSKIGVVNGQLAVVTNNEYVGVIKYYEPVTDQSYMEFN